MADFGLSVDLNANISNFVSSMSTALTAYNSLDNGVDPGKIADRFTGMATAINGAIAGLGFASMAKGIDVFKDFESALVGVQKTTDMSGEVLSKFGDDIQKMARDTPVSTNELLKLAEQAGQLGISAENNGEKLKSFVDTISRLSVSTDLGTEEAGNALARISNIMQSLEKHGDAFWNKFGATIVDLGNNMATTESEITNMALRLAGAAQIAGMTEADLAALSATMSSLGIRAEEGGGAMSRVINKIASAVAENGEKLQGFANLAGTSAEEFAKQWKENPTIAIDMLAKGLNKIKESGGDVAGALKELGISGTREVSVLQKMAGAGDLLSEAMERANQAFEDGTALTEESDRAYGTLESSIQKMKNKFEELWVTVGERIAPIVSTLATVIGALVDGFNNLPGPIQSAIVYLGAFVTLVTALNALKGVITLIGGFTSGFSALLTIFTTLGPILATVVGLLTNPIVIAGAIIAGALITIINNFESFKQAFSEVMEEAGKFWGDFMNRVAEEGLIGAVMEKLAGFIEGVKTMFAEGWSKVAEGVSVGWESIKNAIGELISNIKNMFNPKTLVEAGKGIIDGFMDGMKSKWDKAKSWVKGIADWIKKNKGPIDYDRKLLQPHGDAVISGFVDSMKSSWETGKSFVTSIASDISSADMGQLSNAGVGYAPSATSANINLSIGGANFTAFSRDITREVEQERLREYSRRGRV